MVLLDRFSIVLKLKAIGFVGDVRKQEDAARVVELTFKHFGKIDILVNAAAGNFLVSAEDLSHQQAEVFDYPLNFNIPRISDMLNARTQGAKYSKVEPYIGYDTHEIKDVVYGNRYISPFKATNASNLTPAAKVVHVLIANFYCIRIKFHDYVRDKDVFIMNHTPKNLDINPVHLVYDHLKSVQANTMHVIPYRFLITRALIPSQVTTYPKSLSYIGNLALEWGTDYDIRVNGIALGPISGTPDMSKLAPDEINNKSKDYMPLYKEGEKWDIAMAALFLVSDAGKYINGDTLIVDGGLWLSRPRHLPNEAVKQASRAIEKRSRNQPIGVPKSKL